MKLQQQLSLCTVAIGRDTPSLQRPYPWLDADRNRCDPLSLSLSLSPFHLNSCTLSLSYLPFELCTRSYTYLHVPSRGFASSMLARNAWNAAYRLKLICFCCRTRRMDEDGQVGLRGGDQVGWQLEKVECDCSLMIPIFDQDWLARPNRCSLKLGLAFARQGLREFYRAGEEC